MVPKLETPSDFSLDCWLGKVMVLATVQVTEQAMVPEKVRVMVLMMDDCLAMTKAAETEMNWVVQMDLLLVCWLVPHWDPLIEQGWGAVTVPWMAPMKVSQKGMCLEIH